MERSCELCSKAARMYCESDEARLCWDCDEKVHSANFLVAKHSRTLLCHVCQSPTPWKASGTKLGPTVSVCEGCSDAQNPTTSRMRMTRRPHPHEEAEEQEDQTDRSFGMEDGDRESESSSARSTDEEYRSDEEEEEIAVEEEDGENQVVPWASCPSQSAPSAPPLTTSSSSEHGSFSTRNDALKRSRDTHIHDSDVRQYPIFPSPVLWQIFVLLCLFFQ